MNKQCFGTTARNVLKLGLKTRSEMLCPWISLQKNAHGKRESKVLPVFS
jgi:hypothetical protein